MKRVLFITLTIIATLSADAQIWLSGEATFRTSSSSLSSDKLGTYTSLELTPQIGYWLSDRWSVGLRLGYAHFENAEVKLIDQSVVGAGNEVSVAPFARYVFSKIGNFSFFADADGHYDALIMESFESPLHTLGIGISPGLTFAINGKIGLTARLGNISIDHSWMKNRGNYTWMKVPGKTLTNNTISLHLFDRLSFGIYANL